MFWPFSEQWVPIYRGFQTGAISVSSFCIYLQELGVLARNCIYRADVTQSLELLGYVCPWAQPFRHTSIFFLGTHLIWKPPRSCPAWFPDQSRSPLQPLWYSLPPLCFPSFTFTGTQIVIPPPSAEETSMWARASVLVPSLIPKRPGKPWILYLWNEDHNWTKSKGRKDWVWREVSRCPCPPPVLSALPDTGRNSGKAPLPHFLRNAFLCSLSF